MSSTAERHFLNHLTNAAAKMFNGGKATKGRLRTSLVRSSDIVEEEAVVVDGDKFALGLEFSFPSGTKKESILERLLFDQTNCTPEIIICTFLNIFLHRIYSCLSFSTALNH